MAKKCKIEKETRRVIEGISELVKYKGDRYKFRTKNKKTIKKIRRTCVHWVIRKHKELPSLVRDTRIPGNWKCSICNVSFPIKPFTRDEYDEIINRTLMTVNQIQFWAVSLGGDAEDTKMFLNLKRDLPRFEKVCHQVLKQVNKRQSLEENRENSDIMSRFDAYAGFNYKH